MQNDSTSISGNLFWYSSLRKIYIVLALFNVLELAGLCYIFYCSVTYANRWKWVYVTSNVYQWDLMIRVLHEWLNAITLVFIIIFLHRLLRITQKMGYRPVVRLWQFFPGMILPIVGYIVQYVVMRDFIRKSGQKLNSQDAQVHKSLLLLRPWIVMYLLLAGITYLNLFKWWGNFTWFGIPANIYLLTLKAISGVAICVLQIQLLGVLESWNKQVSQLHTPLPENEVQDNQLLDN